MPTRSQNQPDTVIEANGLSVPGALIELEAIAAEGETRESLGRERYLERMWRFIRETGVTHFLFEPSTEEALAPTLAPRQDRLELVYRPPGAHAAVVHLARPEGP